MKSLSIKSALVCAVSLMVAGTALAHDTELCQIAPKNDVKIPIGFHSKAGSGLTEATYNATIDRVENYYKPIVAALGKTLTFNRLWTTEDANSTAHQSGNTWFVDAYGGLARYPIMTQDGEMAVLCHEMGHHLGGYPKGKILGLFTSWGSNEGQADYFATMKCFRRIAQNDDNVTAMASVSLPKEVKLGCASAFHSQSEIALCQREAMAGQVLAQILYELGTHPQAIPHAKAAVEHEPAVAPSFTTPNTTLAVSRTNDSHPLAQCRLDTYFNGAICGADPMEDFGKSEGSTGACAQEKGDTYGFRPTCWYKPSRS
jgi:hypothetical protein